MRRRSILLSIAIVFVGTTSSINWFNMPQVFSSEKIVEQVKSFPTPDPAIAQQTELAELQRIEAEKAAQAVAAAPKVTAPARATTVAIKGNSLSIPSIGFQAPIVSVGLTTGNAIDVPSGMQVGYYVGSAKPGTLGASFLDGHVDGIFPKLSKLTVGQTISITYDGQQLNYRVVNTEIVSLNGIDMNKALSVQSGSNEGLNIMTCAGTYVPSAGTYDKRLVIYTVRIS